MSTILNTLTGAPLVIISLWKKFWRLIYKPLGFARGSAFSLFAIFGGNLLFFPLMSFKLIGDNTPAGGIFYFSTGYNPVGNKIHLIGLLLGCLFAFHQFIPIIRQKAPVVDQIIGYIATILYLISQAGLLVNLGKAGGGDVSAIVALGLVVVASTSSLFIAYYNALNGNGPRFREWRIRAWGWAGTVITLRLMIFGIAMLIKAMPSGPWYTVQPCSLIYNTYVALGLTGDLNPTAELYPACTGPEPTSMTAVGASFKTPEGMATVYNYCFALVTFLSFVIHSAVLELYFRKTTASEAELIRPVSTESSTESGVVVEEKTGTTVTEMAVSQRQH